MKKPLAVTLLIFIGSAATIGIPLGLIAWLSSGLAAAYISPMITVLAAIVTPIVIQTAAFVLLRRRYKTKYGLSSPKFVVCSVLPPIGVAIIGMIVLQCMVAAGVFGEPNPRVYPDDRAYFEMLSAWAVIAYAVCFTVTLSLALTVVSAIENYRECPKKSFIRLSAAVNGILTLVLSGVFVCLLSKIDSIFLTGLIVLIPHIAASVIVFLKLERRFGARNNEFLCSTGLPAVLLNTVMFMLSLFFVSIGGGDLGYGFMAVAMFAGVYSLVYLIGVSVVTSFCKPL